MKVHSSDELSAITAWFQNLLKKYFESFSLFPCTHLLFHYFLFAFDRILRTSTNLKKLDVRGLQRITPEGLQVLEINCQVIIKFSCRGDGGDDNK